MSIPHRCPICEGRGEVGPRLAQTGAELISKKPQRFVCHGCNKTGIVWDNSFHITLNPPQPSPNPYVPYTPNTSPQWPDGTIISNNGDCPGIINPKFGILDDGTVGPVVPMGELVTDHICGSHHNPPSFCKYCFDQRRYNGANCSCSPEGMPHSEECKGFFPGAISKEQLENAAQK